KVHSPADERSVKSLRGDADDRMHDTVEPLCFADDFGIASKAALPKPIADHRDGMRALALVFTREEAPAENGAHASSVEIIRGNDATYGVFGAIADAKSGAGNFADEGRFAQRATSLQVKVIGPGERAAAFFATGAGGAADGDEAFLMHNGGVGAEEDAF